MWGHWGALAFMWGHWGALAFMWGHWGALAFMWGHWGALAFMWGHWGALAFMPACTLVHCCVCTSSFAILQYIAVHCIASTAYQHVLLAHLLTPPPRCSQRCFLEAPLRSDSCW